MNTLDLTDLGMALDKLTSDGFELPSEAAGFITAVRELKTPAGALVGAAAAVHEAIAVGDVKTIRQAHERLLMCGDGHDLNDAYRGVQAAAASKARDMIVDVAWDFFRERFDKAGAKLAECVALVDPDADAVAAARMPDPEREAWAAVDELAAVLDKTKASIGVLVMDLNAVRIRFNDRDPHYWVPLLVDVADANPRTVVATWGPMPGKYNATAPAVPAPPTNGRGGAWSALIRQGARLRCIPRADYAGPLVLPEMVRVPGGALDPLIPEDAARIAEREENQRRMASGYRSAR
jgi:hypothetical protein